MNKMATLTCWFCLPALLVHERQRRHLLAVRSIVEGNAKPQIVASTMGTPQVTRPSDVAAQQFLDDMLVPGHSDAK